MTLIVTAKEKEMKRKGRIITRGHLAGLRLPSQTEHDDNDNYITIITIMIFIMIIVINCNNNETTLYLFVIVPTMYRVFIKFCFFP